MVPRLMLPGLLLLIVTGCSSLSSILPVKILSVKNTETAVGKPATKNVVQPSARADRLFQQANTALGEKDYAAAEQLLLQLISVYPQYASSYTNLGIVYANTQREEQAYAQFDRALVASPNDCQPLVQIGLLARQQRDFIRAEASFKRCILVNPDFAAAHLELGILYELYMGRLVASLSAYHTAQRIQPDNRVARWIVLLQRRLDAADQLAVNGANQ